MIFQSAVDGWYYLLLVVIALVILFSVLLPVRNGQLSPVFAVGIVLVSLGLPFWLLFDTYYQVTPHHLKIKAGPRSWSIALETITSVKPSHSTRSAPALSLNRLDIRYANGKQVLVSPANREAFLKAIGQRSID